MTFTEILEYNFLEVGGYSLNLLKISSAILVLVGAKILLIIIDRTFLERFFRKRNVDIGRKYATRTILKYIVYTAALIWAIQLIGIHLSVFWGGAAALLVGVGLGLQQTFNDLISGIILLSEATVEVGDIVSVDGVIGTVRDIGIRTSKVETLDDISIIIPNSKLVVDQVVNWSHKDSPNRFQVAVGVAYGSDVQLVTSLLLQAARSHQDVLAFPEPKVQFKDFGASSLDFVLHYYSHNFIGSEFVKSDLRYEIVELFEKNNISIPFPQRDVWIRSEQNK
ncbi:MAG: mechanosensitive ion channel domain-containing protein [Bacteroidota bacterium]